MTIIFKIDIHIECGVEIFIVNQMNYIDIRLMIRNFNQILILL
jgi:hypothetical protein